MSITAQVKQLSPDDTNGIPGIRRFTVDVHAETVMDVFRSHPVNGRIALQEMIAAELVHLIMKEFPEDIWK